MIILDNSDWLPASALRLGRAGLIEVDLSGPVPGNNHHQTTSFFLSRDFNFKPAASRQPKLPIGGRPDNWEKKLEAELLAEENINPSVINKTISLTGSRLKSMLPKLSPILSLTRGSS